ncbi:eukaryotic translation elongation factor 2-like isoform X2 [Rhynchophorus ferrugineus]|uniref:eukaryotic translation elongation factor 2-like isoform X2 n=1 Tax=Rhynchophorus ferrugineus TaxID=354439 RepID=UPI003FCDBCA8
MYILNPIYKIFDLIISCNKEENEPFLSTLRIILRCENKYKDGKQFSGTWLPASGTLLQMIAVHLPSPVTALIYRMEMLYEGIKNCDPNGPMIMCLKCSYRHEGPYPGT